MVGTISSYRALAANFCVARHSKGAVQKHNASLLIYDPAVEVSITIIKFIAARSRT